VTPEILEWKPWPRALSGGQIIRHLAGAERFFVTKVVEDRWTDALDPGPSVDLAACRAMLDAAHRDETARLLALPDRRLKERVKDFAGGEVSVWRLLMAMAEHEIHHRSQLSSRLSASGIGAPPLYGYEMEEVIARGRSTQS
jgi:uncharacterized damage-inducible protein DinB